jgi:hypothetical protein
MSSEPPAPKSALNGELVPERYAGLSLSEKLKKAQAEADRWRERSRKWDRRRSNPALGQDRAS